MGPSLPRCSRFSSWIAVGVDQRDGHVAVVDAHRPQGGPRRGPQLRIGLDLDQALLLRAARISGAWFSAYSS